MNIVSFYAPRDHEKHVYDFISCLRLQKASCEQYDCKQIVITDTDLEFDTFRCELPESLMKAILQGQMAYLKSDAFDRDTILTGADCLLGKDPRQIFDGTFDLGVTTHPFYDCILNTGAIFCPRASRDLIIPFWERASESVGDNWGDDQLALASVIQPTLTHGIELRDEARVRFMPCREHNWAPANSQDRINSTIVHFRGARKRWMPEWRA